MNYVAKFEFKVHNKKNVLEHINNSKKSIYFENFIMVNDKMNENIKYLRLFIIKLQQNKKIR